MTKGRRRAFRAIAVLLPLVLASGVAEVIARGAALPGPPLLIFAVFPYFPKTPTWDHYSAEPITGKLLAEARTHGMETVDLKEPDGASDPAAGYDHSLFSEPDRCHMGEQGHALLASYLETHLVDRVRASPRP